MLLAAIVACAPAKPLVVVSEFHERPPPAAPAPEPPPAPPDPECPKAMRSEHPLETLLGASLSPGTWHPDAAPGTLGFAGSWVERFRKRLPLSKGAIEIAGLHTPAIASVVLFAPWSGGSCVINAWSAFFPVEVREISLGGTWVSPDGRLAVALVRLSLPSGPLWIALATDGERAWMPLGGPGQHQLPVPRVALRPSGRKLYLDVMLNQTTVFALRPDGMFERVGP